MPTSTSERAELNLAKARKEEVMAKIRELELATRLGEVVETEAVRREWAASASLIQNAILGIPARAAPRLNGTLSARESQKVLEEVVNNVLLELADALDPNGSRNPESAPNTARGNNAPRTSPSRGLGRR